MYRDGVRQERTGWRDEAISQRHRLWGCDCPAVDLDLVMVEYNRAAPAALVEYKAAGAQIPNLSQPTYVALSRLASAAAIPFFVVFYFPDTWWFQVRPGNDHAKRFCAEKRIMSEREYVRLLYQLRGLALPEELRQQLRDYKPRVIR